MPAREDGLFERKITSEVPDVSSLSDQELIDMATVDLGSHVYGVVGEDLTSPSAKATSALLVTLFNLPDAEADLTSSQFFTDAEINRRSATFKELGSRLTAALIEDLGLPYTKDELDG